MSSTYLPLRSSVFEQDHVQPLPCGQHGISKAMKKAKKEHAYSHVLSEGGQVGTKKELLFEHKKYFWNLTIFSKQHMSGHIFRVDS